MTIFEAITRANTLRANTLGDAQKYAWANDLDGQIAEMMGKDAPLSVFPEDRELLMPSPHEEIYQLYLVSKIDYYNNERYQWQLAKLAPNEYYNYITTGIYPIK